MYRAKTPIHTNSIENKPVEDFVPFQPIQIVRVNLTDEHAAIQLSIKNGDGRIQFLISATEAPTPTATCRKVSLRTVVFIRVVENCSGIWDRRCAPENH